MRRWTLMINPNDDGITHINIYSKGKTELGRMLSNFYKYPVVTQDGDFMSVEGYWYWMSIENCSEREVLRKCYGSTAKSVGKSLLETHKSSFETNFEVKILYAIYEKFSRNSSLILPQYLNLPFEHYYNYGGKIVDVKSKYLWMIEGITSMRSLLTDHIK